MQDFGVGDVAAFLEQVFAPWVQDLGIETVGVTEAGARFRLPENEALVRQNKGAPAIVCGQAIAAVADTASVLTLCLLNKRIRNCTTVDMTTHFLRPIPLGDVEVEIEAVSNGRRMAVTRARFRAAGSEKPAAVATCTFAYLED